MRDNNGTSTTTLYLGNVEKVIAPGGSYTWKRYITDGVLIEQTHDKTGKRTGEVTCYLLYDHLGSVDVITDAFGTVVQDFSFDAWGQRRAPDEWTVLALMRLTDTGHGRYTTRGYTGHEMLDAVGIIHMNGRIYDPRLGRFMQADPVIQFPDYSQSWNRYSYVLNNPLAYTDPTGYFPVFTALAVVGLIAADITSKIIIAAVIGTAVFADSLAQGVPLDKAFLAGVSAAALTAVALGTFPKPVHGGFGWNVATYGHLASVATVGGITASLQGGKFGHGFLSAGIGAGVGGIPALRGVSAGRVAARTVVSAVTAGTVSEITGGKFANGAMTAAFFSLVSSAAQTIKFKHGAGHSVSREIAEANFEKAREKILAGLKDGSLDIGLPEEYIRGGFDSISFELVPDIDNGMANVSYTDLGYGPVTDVTIRVDYSGAVTLGEALHSIGHEIRHLTVQNRALSVKDPDGVGPRLSPQETDANHWGRRVRKHFGQ